MKDSWRPPSQQFFWHCEKLSRQPLWPLYLPYRHDSGINCLFWSQDRKSRYFPRCHPVLVDWVCLSVAVVSNSSLNCSQIFRCDKRCSFKSFSFQFSSTFSEKPFLLSLISPFLFLPLFRSSAYCHLPCPPPISEDPISPRSSTFYISFLHRFFEVRRLGCVGWQKSLRLSTPKDLRQQTPTVRV